MARRKKCDKYTILRDAGKLSGTLKSCRLKAALRHERRTVEAQPRTCVIPLGRGLAAEMQSLGQEVFSRLRNWEGPPEETNDLTLKHMPAVTRNHGRYSSRCSYLRLTYHLQLRSCGIATAGRLLWFFKSKRGVLQAPRGWRFGRDSLGLFVCRLRDTDAVNPLSRYHFCMQDIIRDDLLRSAIAHETQQRLLLRTRRKKDHDLKRLRKQQAAVLREAYKYGVWVYPGDSVRAGNCPGGTMLFARQNKLGTRAVCAVVLGNLARRPGLPVHVQDQIQRAIVAAETRSIIELTRGYCLLPRGAFQGPLGP